MQPSFTLSVTELNEYVRSLFGADRLLNGLRLRGEISNFKRHSSGHLYFSLKDAGAVIRCVMFKQSTFGLGFFPKDGLNVVADGYVSLYVRDGAYQFYCETLEPDGVGALYALYEKTKQRLLAEGLFDAGHKRPLPTMPKTIGVVTSPTGAVIRDIIKVARRRNPSVHILLYPSRVQGDGAAAEIVAGIRALQTENVDVIICGRGGGSLEDLWPFNEESVARAIYKSTVPVISAVGHETDTTIADFAADVRAATPSQAAELAVPDVRQGMQRLDDLGTDLAQETLRFLAASEQRLQMLYERGGFRRAASLFDGQSQRAANAHAALTRAVKARLEKSEAQLMQLRQRLNGANPKAVLARGYAIVRDGQGTALSSAAAFSAGMGLEIQLHDGAAKAVVTKANEQPADQIGFFSEEGEQ